MTEPTTIIFTLFKGKVLLHIDKKKIKKVMAMNAAGVIYIVNHFFYLRKRCPIFMYMSHTFTNCFLDLLLCPSHTVKTMIS